ncbi:MAG: hypothetical protein GC202_00795 [Alphaproteobacteria bacterium]|nr:hypothetical protein [Alphaproteobacteria bacterium]
MTAAWLPVAITAAVLVQSLAGPALVRPLVLVLIVCWLVGVFGRTRSTERAFLAGALASAVAVAALGGEWRSILGVALDRGAEFVALMTSLGLLRDAARTSRAVRRAGNWLIRQSPSWRFLAIALGGHGFGIALNMGAVTLLATLIKRSNTLEAAGGDPEVVAIREERMNVALLQGFFSMLVWSPMAISVAFTLSMIRSVSWFDICLPALSIAGLFLAVGWIVDRIKWPPSRRRSIPRTGPPPPVSDVLPMVGIILGLVASVLGAKALFRFGMIESIAWFAGLFAIVWLYVQYVRAGTFAAFPATGRRLRVNLHRFVPEARGEQIVLGAASFLGVTLATLLQRFGASALLDAWQPSGFILAMTIVLFVVIGSQFGIVALVTSAIAGGAVMGMRHMPLTPFELVIALQVGWSLSATLSPYSGGTMLMARIMERDPSVFRRWSTPWAIVCFMLFGLIAWWRL